MPGEVATPILDNRPIPVPDEERARMVQAEDCGEVIRFLAQLPNHVCINDLTISPTWNRAMWRAPGANFSRLSSLMVERRVLAVVVPP